MKILLIEPNLEGLTLMPTMSLSILKGYINKKTEHEAKIVDLAFHKKKWKEYLFKEMENEKPDLIGLSVLSFNYNQASRIARFIKNNFNVKIILGGVHAILSTEEVIENPNVDIVCIGEGEDVLKEILDKNLNLKNIKGIWYKGDGEIIKNPIRLLKQDLDEIGFPDWEDFDLEKYFIINNNHLPIMASRGCPYNCTYCSNHALKKKLKGKYVRFRSIEHVLDEIDLRIKQYYKKGLRYLFFYDDTFILDKDYVLEFCRKFKERGFDKLLKWNINVRANLVTDEIIQAIKNAGCYEVRMGVEASNNYIRNEIYKRNMSKEQIFNAIRIIKKNKLQLRLQFILGAPYETLKMMEESFDMAKNSEADYILFPILMPLPDTEIKEMCEKEGLIEKKGFKNSHEMYFNPVVRTKYASREQIKKVVDKVRMHQIKKHFLTGLRLRRFIFLWDLFTFFSYYKPRYGLDTENVYRFTVNKYKLEDLGKQKNNL